jgi:hypothetical protein
VACSFFFSNLPVSRRHTVIAQLAATFSDGSYHTAQLRKHIESSLAPITAIAVDGIRSDIAMGMLLGKAGLSRSAAVAMSMEAPEILPASAAQLFSGSYPLIPTRDLVATFLGVDEPTVAGLFDHGLILERLESDAGYNIDNLLDAERFLKRGLLDLWALQRLVGVPLDWDSLRMSTLLPRWNSRSPTDQRVAVERVVSIQLRLNASCESAQAPPDPVLLQELAAGHERPFLLVSEFIAGVLNGAVGHLAWHSPFIWASLVFDRSEAKRLMDNLSATSLGLISDNPRPKRGRGRGKKTLQPPPTPESSTE